MSSFWNTPKSEKDSVSPQPFTDDELSPWMNPVGGEPSRADEADKYLAGEEKTGSAFENPSPVGSTPSSSTRNVLNSDVTVVGTLRFTDDLLVDGSVEGEITSDGVLTVGANAVIQAGEKNKVAVRTKSAIIHGRVTGDVVVSERVELASTAELVGDITAARIAIQEGAVFVGHCMVGNVTAMPATPPVQPKRSSKRTQVVDDTPNLLG